MGRINIHSKSQDKQSCLPDMSGLTVENEPVGVYPQACQLAQHVYHLKGRSEVSLVFISRLESDLVGLEVVDEYVWQPELLHELQVHGDEYLRLSPTLVPLPGPLGVHVQPVLHPLHVEVGRERDAVVLDIRLGHS